MALTLLEHYKLTPSQMQIRYRRASEEKSGFLDYLRYDGRHRQEVCFPLTWKDAVTGATCHIKARFGSAKAFKFWNLCRDNIVQFSLKDGHPVLLFLHPYSLQEIAGITLEHQGNE